MTLTDAIQHLKESLADPAHEWGCEECKQEHEQLLEWLEDYKRLQSVNSWIPCSAKLPEVGEPVLIYEPYNEEMVVASLDCDKTGFSNDDYWYGLKSVPFWMALPEKPKGE
jgi:hypothetical protein